MGGFNPPNPPVNSNPGVRVRVRFSFSFNDTENRTQLKENQDLENILLRHLSSEKVRNASYSIRLCKYASGIRDSTNRDLRL